MTSFVRFSVKAITICAALSMTAGLAFAGDNNVSSDQIVRALQPKPLTRGLSFGTPQVDPAAKAQLASTVRLDSVKADDYDTVFYPGGHGPMWDLAEDPNSIKLIESFLAAGKPVDLVCHAPGVLRHVTDADAAGRPLADVAGTAIGTLQPHVEREFARLHGRLPGAGIATIGLGKLGSREMTVTSDLDLIFIYDVPIGADRIMASQASICMQPISPASREDHRRRLLWRLARSCIAPRST